MKLLTTGVIGMMVMCCIQSGKLLHHEASSAVAIYCFGPLKTQFISGLLDSTVIVIIQLRFPELADLSLASISCLNMFVHCGRPIH